MRLARLVPIGLWFLSLCAGAQERSPGVKRLEFVIEVDVAKARALNWAAKEASDEQVVENASRLVQRRFEAMQRAARVELEPATKRFRVSLPSLDARDRELFEGMLRSIGLCEFLFMADADSAKARIIDLGAEEQKLSAWTKANPRQPIETFDLLATESQGPARGLAWFATSFGGKIGEPRAVLLPEAAADVVGAASFERVFTTADHFGYPAIGFELHASRTDDFARLTESHVNQRMAVLFGDSIVSAPSLNSKLIGSGLIEGKFSESDVESWLEAFQKLEGPLRIVEPR